MSRDFMPIFIDEFGCIAETLNNGQLGRLTRALVQYCKYGHGDVREDIAEAYALYTGIIDNFNSLKNGRPAGEFHWNWKGGKTPANQVDRSSSESKAWRAEVFARDGFRCQICGAVGGDLNAHHIKPWATHPEARYDVNNGVTLCKTCHKELHKKLNSTKRGGI